MIRVTMTEVEFIAALERAILDDERWPWLCCYTWLLNHAHSRDGQVTIDTGVQLTPGKAMDH